MEAEIQLAGLGCCSLPASYPVPVILVAGWNWPLQYLENAAAWRAFCFDTTRPGFPLVYELSALTEFRVLAAWHPVDSCVAIVFADLAAIGLACCGGTGTRSWLFMR
jgi:hypothetical protein